MRHLSGTPHLSRSGFFTPGMWALPLETSRYRLTAVDPLEYGFRRKIRGSSHCGAKHSNDCSSAGDSVLLGTHEAANMDDVRTVVTFKSSVLC